MQGRRGENDVKGLGRTSVNILFPEQIYNFTHNTSRGSNCAFWGI